MDRDYDVMEFLTKKLCFEKAGVAIFADIIKIVSMFIETILKD